MSVQPPFAVVAQLPSPEGQRLLVKASRWCRDTFPERDQLERCIGAFRAPSGEEARARLLCAMVGGTPEEREECVSLQRGLSASDAIRILSRRFSPRDVENAQRLLQVKSQHDGDVYGAEDLFALYERLPRPAPPPPPPTAEEVVREAEVRGMIPFRRAPPAAPPSPPAPAPPRDLAAGIRAGVAGPRLTPLQVATFPLAVQDCLQKTKPPANVMDAVIAATVDIDARLFRQGEDGKLVELCHQVGDAIAFGAAPTPEALDRLRTLADCLACPEAPTSLLRSLGGAS